MKSNQLFQVSCLSLLVSALTISSVFAEPEAMSNKQARKEAYEKCSEQTLSAEVKDKFNECRKSKKTNIKAGLDKKRCMKDVPADQRQALIECVKSEIK